jgi:uncharacterized protein (TIGR00730 family)
MRVTVFCGSSPGSQPAYVDAARELGKLLADRGIGLVYGGAKVGTMGVMADAALAAGGEVIGVIPRTLVEWEVAHDGLTELYVVETMHERKARMAELGDGFVTLPGGAGTLEELFEVWTWGPLLGLHAKPVGLLNVQGYYDQLVAFVDHMVGQDFVRPEQRATLLVDDDPARLLERFAAYRAPPPRFAIGRGPDADRPAVVDALAWVHVRDGRVLTVRTRGRDAFYLPGGKRERGESDWEALVREVREELSVGLRQATFEPLGVFDAPDHHHPEGTRVRMACYRAAYDGELRGAGEIDEIAWLTYDQRDLCAPAARLVLDDLHARGELR